MEKWFLHHVLCSLQIWAFLWFHLCARRFPLCCFSHQTDRYFCSADFRVVISFLCATKLCYPAPMDSFPWRQVFAFIWEGALSSLVLGLPVSCLFLAAARPSSVSIFSPRELEVGLVFFLQTTPQGLRMGLVMVFPLYLHKIHLSCCQYFKVFLMRGVEWAAHPCPPAHERQLCFCWHLLYFTTDCTRSTVKF